MFLQIWYRNIFRGSIKKTSKWADPTNDFHKTKENYKKHLVGGAKATRLQ